MLISGKQHQFFDCQNNYREELEAFGNSDCLYVLRVRSGHSAEKAHVRCARWVSSGIVEDRGENRTHGNRVRERISRGIRNEIHQRSLLSRRGIEFDVRGRPPRGSPS